ncbi:MAG: hypothetical protein MZV49_07880 [Rhodopseudomonas palustris]|nr:hypothetical protein [Rhodopseudomonas palustris]
MRRARFRWRRLRCPRAAPRGGRRAATGTAAGRRSGTRCPSARPEAEASAQVAARGGHQGPVAARGRPGPAHRQASIYAANNAPSKAASIFEKLFGRVGAARRRAGLRLARWRRAQRRPRRAAKYRPL